MRTFCVPDIHGRLDALRNLLLKAGCIDEEGRRTDEVEWDELVADGADPDALLRRSFRVISIGDLANAVREDINGDEECLLAARDWFDYLIIGNHEAGWLFTGITFNGFVPTPHLRSLYNAYYRGGFVVPAVLIGDTLLTHAGVQEYFGFESAEIAFDAIYDVWENYNDYRDDYSQKFEFDDGSRKIEIPKALLLDGVPKERGGSTPMGGILWSDWHEAKNSKFSQVVGHSPQRDRGPVLHEYLGAETFHLNIDCAAKSGMAPVGVWLDEEGRIEEYVWS